jgi:ATPase subunit of ABC transporter with duplicated ATPase domains
VLCSLGADISPRHQRYQGTVLLVSHDEDLIDEVATRVWHFENDQITDFRGAYEEYETVLV